MEEGGRGSGGETTPHGTYEELSDIDVATPRLRARHPSHPPKRISSDGDFRGFFWTISRAPSGKHLRPGSASHRR